MSNSWGHTAYRLTDEEIAKFVQLGWTCSCGGPRGRCDLKAEYCVEYSYVTGRAGRTSYAQKKACIEHAKKFAAKHKVEILPAQPRAMHASEQAIEQILPEKDHEPKSI
jgi:hypothetical protein